MPGINLLVEKTYILDPNFYSRLFFDMLFQKIILNAIRCMPYGLLTGRLISYNESRILSMISSWSGVAMLAVLAANNAFRASPPTAEASPQVKSHAPCSFCCYKYYCFSALSLCRSRDAGLFLLLFAFPLAEMIPNSSWNCLFKLVPNSVSIA